MTFHSHSKFHACEMHFEMRAPPPPRALMRARLANGNKRKRAHGRVREVRGALAPRRRDSRSRNGFQSQCTLNDIFQDFSGKNQLRISGTKAAFMLQREDGLAKLLTLCCCPCCLPQSPPTVIARCWLASPFGGGE